MKKLTEKWTENRKTKYKMEKHTQIKMKKIKDGENLNKEQKRKKRKSWQKGMKE